MSKPTLHDLTVAALKARGAVEVKRGKYTVLTRTKNLRGEPVEAKSFWFVGKSGAVRSGPNARDSRPLDDGWKDQLLVEGEGLAPCSNQRRS